MKKGKIHRILLVNKKNEGGRGIRQKNFPNQRALTLPELELERGASITAGIELSPVKQRPGVMH